MRSIVRHLRHTIRPPRDTPPAHAAPEPGKPRRPYGAKFGQRGYHTYTVIIDRRDAADQQIRWYLDGTLFFTVAES